MKITIKNALTLTPQGAGEHTVYIDGDAIAVLDAPPADFKADRVIDGAGKLLTPGLINAHTHVYMTAMRNRADDLPLMSWLNDRVWPMEDSLTEEDGYWGTLLGIMELLLGGATAFLDMDIFSEATARALADSAFRGGVSKGLTDISGWDGGLERLEIAQREIEKYKHLPNVEFFLAPHAPYTCSEKYLTLIAERANDLGVGIHTHLSESLDEQETALKQYGLTPAQLYDRCGLLTEKTVCAHCVFLSDEDIALLAARGVSVAHNPASNMKLANGFAPVSKMLDAGINVALGTDGCCSNNNQNMLREMTLAALIGKGTAQDATVLPAAKVFNMATKNGARALGATGLTGEITVGSKADLALFPLDFPGFFPLGDPLSALCYAGAGLRAETVLVGGKILLDKGEFTTIDADKVFYNVRKTNEKF
ncbi:MAG: amidohydrolase [Oscillospiraceae bacterium]|nr:amidohydrolase [Oscillospiraceae bacterium]